MNPIARYLLNSRIVEHLKEVILYKYFLDQTQ
jgi:hypothetical protein